MGTKFPFDWNKNKFPRKKKSWKKKWFKIFYLKYKVIYGPVDVITSGAFEPHNPLSLPADFYNRNQNYQHHMDGDEIKLDKQSSIKK